MMYHLRSKSSSHCLRVQYRFKKLAKGFSEVSHATHNALDELDTRLVATRTLSKDTYGITDQFVFYL